MSPAAHPDHLVVSPHPDDAVWSAGGLIARWRAAGRRVAVLTVFDGDPDGDVPPERWRQVASPSRRRREDRRGLALLGAAGASAGLPDAALRRTGARPRYASPLRLFGAPHPDDRDLAGRVTAAVRRLAGPATRLYAPLAAGGHVDHVLVRGALEAARDLRPRLSWYEDFPYRLRRRHHAGLAPACEPVDMDPWVAAATSYASQAEALFGGGEALARALRRRAAARGRQAGLAYGARLWRAPRSPG